MNTDTLTPLFTDQYELVMAQSYWHLGMAERESVFELFFRHNPFNGHYTICCGLERVIHFINNFKFTADDISYLETLRHLDGTPVFKKEFLDYLVKLQFTCNVDAIPEGTVVFPLEPLLRIQGPILQCQILETAIINFINYSSLIATKAARICHVAEGPVVEFGARRAQGPDGALLASRSAFVGGCVGTSNMLAGKLYDIPTYGTQAHSWIMVFENEITAFRNFADLMQSNTVLLVDTYDTNHGLQNAIEVGRELQKQGANLFAIRLDSGNLATLSKKARSALDDAGLVNTKIMVSGELDEYAIAKLKAKKAAIDIWGAGTKLVTAADQPFLNIIYKLSAIRNTANKWEYKMKFSADQPEKTTNPGIHQVRRYYKDFQCVRDVIYDLELGIDDMLPVGAERYEDLLIPIFRAGKLVYQQPGVHEVREFCLQQLRQFLENKSPANYPVRFENQLQALKAALCQSVTS